MTAPRIVISAVTQSEADEKLNAAALELQHLAKDNPVRGILVTRLAPGRYAVELSSEVPYGLTRERDDSKPVPAGWCSDGSTSASIEPMHEAVRLAA